ncbi:MAG: BTAD domain-containing putative transcriptional regulator, partial [Acidimicrobiales bacterium]
AQALARARAELVELLLALHRPEEAVLPAQEAVAADPAEEAPHRLLIRVHLARGDRAAALVALRRCRDVLNAELGQGPSAETEDLVAWDGHDRRRPSA